MSVPIITYVRANFKLFFKIRIGPNIVFVFSLFLISHQHDTTVACMLAAFGLFNNKQPPYATAFFIELLSDDIG